MQADYQIDNAPGAVVRADINDQLSAIATLNSGATQPDERFPHMYWFDTQNNLLKQRNAANTAWVTVASKSGTTWIPYRAGSPLGTASTRDIGTGNSNNVLDRGQLDSRFARRSQNLSDLSSASSARSNLGLGSMATRSQGTGASAHRTNSQNDSRFLRDSSSTVTATNIVSSERMTTANVAGQTAGVSLGAVGSYAFVRRLSDGVQFPGASPGNTVAGSGLRYASAGGDFGGPTSLPGTWRIMGNMETTGALGSSANTSLALRIS